MDFVNSMNYVERLTAVWLVLQGILLIYAVCVLAAIGRIYMLCLPNTNTLDTNPNWNFFLLIHLFYSVGFSFGGTYLMKNKRSPLTVGAVTGIGATLGIWTLSIAVLQGSMVRNKNRLVLTTCLVDAATSADSALIFFAVLLAFSYFGFSYLLLLAKNELFGDEPLIGSTDNEYIQTSEGQPPTIV